MLTRAEFDRRAWELLLSQKPVPGTPPGYAACRRPSNFAELGRMIEETGDFEHSWSEFRHGFYAYKSPSFFAERSPETLSVECQALLAAAAEELSIRFGLPVPAWTQEPRYTLPEPWDPMAAWYIDVPLENRIASSGPVFRKHNVLFADRGLIAL